MKKHLRLLAWFLTLTMLCELLPLGTFAQSDIGQSLKQAVAQNFEEENSEAVAAGKCGDNLTWSLSNDGTLTISGTGDMYDYSSDGSSVSHAPWSKYLNDIKNVVVNDGVTHIGKLAFANCSNLYSVVLPDTVSSIGEQAFTFCSSLVSINIPDSVDSIAYQTFFGCKSLDTISLPASISSIAPYAFDGCSSLASIVLPSSIATIGRGAFTNCTSLASISIPLSMSSIEYGAFSSCSALEDVYYAGSEDQWNTISIGDKNDSLLNAAMHYQATGSDEGKSFTFGRDNLSFQNSPEYFLQKSNPFLSSFFDFIVDPHYVEGSHNISDEKFDLLTKNYVPRVKEALKLYRYSHWAGSCYGMSTVAALHYVSPTRLPFSASSPYNLRAPINDNSVKDLIDYYYLIQYTPTLRKVLLDRGKFCVDHFDEPLDEITSELRMGFPVLAFLHSKNGEHHAILLLNLLEDTSEFYTIRIYDPNEPNEKNIFLHKFRADNTETSSDFLPITYGDYDCITSYILCKSDLQFLDIRNFYEIGDNEAATDYDQNFVIVKSDCSLEFKWGRAYYRNSNNKLVEYSSDINFLSDCSTLADGVYQGNSWISIPTPADSSDFILETTSSDSGIMSMLLNDTLLSIFTSAPVSLTYNEEARTVDVTAENPTDINILMTQNTTTTEWPWHSWAIDTTGTTKFHAELDDDGLHLSGDGIANAQYATENADTNVVANGTIPANANDVTIVKKDANDQQTEIKNNTTPSEPTDPDKLTVTVVNGKITAIADVPTADDPTASDDVTEGAKITITADDKSAENKTFNKWVITAGGVTLDDESNPTTSFTMGKESVTITAQYNSNTPDPIPTPDPTPTPGGGDSGSGGSSSGGSSGGGGGGDGAAIVLGLGAAAAITAGVILTMPVDVQGHVELADHAAVPGAKISLLQKGNVVTQTTADESGNFSLKAKRGDYELIVVYTDANGQFVQKSTSIKAPAKDLVITF